MDGLAHWLAEIVEVQDGEDRAPAPRAFDIGNISYVHIMHKN
jgi:hypothetical protein